MRGSEGAADRRWWRRAVSVPNLGFGGCWGFVFLADIEGDWGTSVRTWRCSEDVHRSCWYHIREFRVTTNGDSWRATTVRGAPVPVTLAMLRAVSGIVLSCRVTSPTSHACEWSIAWRCTVEPHCITLSTRLAGYDDAACPHVEVYTLYPSVVILSPFDD
jgi:hypothetical protein